MEERENENELIFKENNDWKFLVIIVVIEKKTFQSKNQEILESETVTIKINQTLQCYIKIVKDKTQKTTTWKAGQCSGYWTPGRGAEHHKSDSWLLKRSMETEIQ